MEHVEELVGFLESPRADVRKAALEHVLSLTGSDGGVAMLNAVDKDIGALLARLLGEAKDTAKLAAYCLVNISTNERIRDDLVEKKALWSALLEGLSEIAKSKEVTEFHIGLVKLLVNLTTTVAGAKRYLEGRLGPEYPGFDMRILMHVFLKRPRDMPDGGLVLTNMARLDEGRDVILNPDQTYFRDLVKLMRTGNQELRASTAETIRNCCFSTEKHKFMLKKAKLAEHLMIPLLGPEGIVDQDDYDELPLIVKNYIEQTADEDLVLEREEDQNIRKSIIESLLLLCTTRRGREILREKKVYAVIKVYHAEETNEETNDKVFKLVDMLLGEEEENGADQSSSDEDDEADAPQLELDMDDIDESPSTSSSTGKIDKSSALFQVD